VLGAIVVRAPPRDDVLGAIVVRAPPLRRYTRRVGDRGTYVSSTQRRVHVAAEVLAVLAVAPFMLYAATRERELRPAEKGLLATAAVGTLVLDSWLLYRFMRDPRL